MRARGFTEPDRKDPDQLRYAAAVIVLWAVILAIAII